MKQENPKPTEIRLARNKANLTVTFDNGEVYSYPAEFLRVVSPSAEVQGHSPDQKQTVGGKSNVEIMKVEPVGNYAIRLTFTDFHDTGIYSWVYLRKIGREQEQMWTDYLAELDAKGLSREPVRMPR
ncbi:MAG: DUF971 domain-containing protein [Fimbriimonadaceae bacterium]|nr:DUF971 domain-containing protein [Alphaproteobacteria bacterium]